MNKLGVGGVFLAVLLLAGLVEAAPAWRVLHDPLTTVRPLLEIKGTEVAMLRRAANIAGFAVPIVVKARVAGPFLHRGANETAYLYGNGNERLALLILRNGKPVLHTRLLNDPVGFSATKEAYTLRDINGDGIRELAVVQAFGDAGFYGSWVNVLDFRTGQPQVIARFKAQEWNCELGTPAGTQRAYRIEVQPGIKPNYRATEFGRDNCGGNKLTRLRSNISPLNADFDDLKFAPRALPLP